MKVLEDGRIRFSRAERIAGCLEEIREMREEAAILRNNCGIRAKPVLYEHHVEDETGEQFSAMWDIDGVLIPPDEMQEIAGLADPRYDADGNYCRDFSGLFPPEEGTKVRMRGTKQVLGTDVTVDEEIDLEEFEEFLLASRERIRRSAQDALSSPPDGGSSP